MIKFLDYREDVQAGRLGNEKLEKTKCQEKFRSLVPPDWQLSVQPYFFNHTDVEKITGAIAALSQDFVL